jgi:hypothetical protein
MKKHKSHQKKEPLVLEVHPIIPESRISSKEGCYFPESHYKHVINTDADVYGINEDGTRQLLLKFRKAVIPNDICHAAFHALESHSKTKNYNRGAAAGKLQSSKLPKYVGKITKKESFRVFYKTKAGRKTKDNIGNMAMSNIAGYYDKPDRNAYSNSSQSKHSRNKKTKKNKSITSTTTSRKPGYDIHGNPLCRTTLFTKKEVAKWASTVPLIQHADKWFKQLVPDRHAVQLIRARKTPKYQIGDTAYSTITLNYDWRTACHKDKGDLEEGFGNLLVLEKAKSGYPECPGYTGGLLGFPRWGVAVDVRQGDFLAMDVHEWHCNTEVHGTGRLSVVCYLRKGMIKCGR